MPRRKGRRVRGLTPMETWTKICHVVRDVIGAKIEAEMRAKTAGYQAEIRRHIRATEQRIGFCEARGILVPEVVRKRLAWLKTQVKT